MPNALTPGGVLDPFGHSQYNLAGISASVTLNANGSMPVSNEGEVSYTAVFDGFTPVAAPTDFINFFGAASKVIRLVQIGLNVTTDSAVATALNMRLAKRSAAGTLGSAVLTGLTAVPHRSDSSAASGVASSVGTANYTTLGTLVGYVRSQRIMPQLGTYTATNFPSANSIIWDFAMRGAQSVQLLAAAEQIGINASGGTLTGTCLFSGWITWTENTV